MKKEIQWTEAQALLREKVSYGDLLCQLAEEASEMAQAALKLRRATEPGNPTPITREKAEAALLEEFADVLLVCSVLGLADRGEEIAGIHIRKTKRWIRRLGDA